MEKMHFEFTGLIELNPKEIIAIQGGDVDGTMKGSGVDITWMGDVYDFTRGFLTAFFS